MNTTTAGYSSSSQSFVSHPHLSPLPTSCEVVAALLVSCSGGCLAVWGCAWVRVLSDMGSISTYTSCLEAALQLVMFEGPRSGPAAVLWLRASWLRTGRQLSGAEVKGEARLGVGGSGRAKTGWGCSIAVKLRVERTPSRGEAWTCSPAFHWLGPSCFSPWAVFSFALSSTDCPPTAAPAPQRLPFRCGTALLLDLSGGWRWDSLVRFPNHLKSVGGQDGAH